MENKDTNKNEEIKEILEGLSSDDSTVVISESDSDGKLEFHFEGGKKSGLIFEEVDASDGGLHFESEAPAEPVEAEPVAEQVAPSVEPLADPEPVKEELSLPEDFDVEEESELVDESNKMWTTYVPRFTEVSETYRMNDDPRPRTEKTEKAEKSALAEIVESDELLDATDESLDDASDVGAVVINLNQKTESPDEQTFSIYKFSEESEPDSPAPEVRERTVEDERAEIESLVHRKEQSSREIEEEVKIKKLLKSPSSKRATSSPIPMSRLTCLTVRQGKMKTPPTFPAV